MSQRNLEITVQGINGLLCSNVAYSDPLGDYAKYKQFFTDKKGKAKTDGVHRAVRVLDWLLSGYWMKEGKVISLNGGPFYSYRVEITKNHSYIS